MRLVIGVVLAGLTMGCARIEQTVRTERGPLLRSFTRPQVLEGGLRGRVSVAWPTLELQVEAHDVCREVSLDEYAEERITERASPAAGPSLSTGIASTLGAGVLFGISFLLSNSPDTSVIDTTGRYGPPPRTIMQGSAVVALAVGLPALVVGTIAWLRTGEETEQRKVEQETGQRDVECHQRGVSGALRLRGARGDVGQVTLTAGVGAIEAGAVRGSIDELLLADRPVELDEAGLLTLGAFSACLSVEAEGALAPESLGEGALLSRTERLRQCRQVRGEAVSSPLQALEAEVQRRRESGAPGAFAPGPSVASFEDAVSAYAPRLSFKAGAPDLARLDAPETLNGQAVFIQGVVAGGVAANIGVLQVGDRELFVFIPPKRAWGGEFGSGVRVEAVAVMAGWQTVGERTLPVARLVWMRTAF